MPPSSGIYQRRVFEDIKNWNLVQNSGRCFVGHVQCRFALDAHNIQFSVSRSSFITRSNIMMHHVASEGDVFIEKDTVHMTLESEPNDAAHMPQKISPSHNARSADHWYSPNQENYHLTCNCNITNYRHPTRDSDARKSMYLPRVLSVMRRCYNQMFPYCEERTYGLSMETWIENKGRSWQHRSSPWRNRYTLIFLLELLLLCLFVTQSTADKQCAVGLTTPGCKFVET